MQSSPFMKLMHRSTVLTYDTNSNNIIWPFDFNRNKTATLLTLCRIGKRNRIPSQVNYVSVSTISQVSGICKGTDNDKMSRRFCRLVIRFFPLFRLLVTRLVVLLQSLWMCFCPGFGKGVDSVPGHCRRLVFPVPKVQTLESCPI